MAGTTRHPRAGPDRIRTRIAAGMLVSSALVTPVIVLSLLYISRMNAVLARVVDVDVELMRIADQTSLAILDARRDEKNMLLFRDSLYLASARAGIERAARLCAEGGALDREFAPVFDSIATDIASYGSQLDTMASLMGPGAAGSSQGLARLRAEHRRLLAIAETTPDTVRRDSAIAAAAGLATGTELPVGGVLGRLLNEQARAIEGRITARTSGIGSRVAARTRQSQTSARRLSAWAQRNIATALLLTAVGIAWLVIALPRRIVRPLKRIANALNRAENGDLDIHIGVQGRDELEQLARQLNRVFARLREIDDRKAGRIQLLEHRFRILTADIAEGVLVFDRAPNVIFANAAVEPLLGRPASEVRGHSLAELPHLEFLRDPLEDALSGSTSHQECGILPGLPFSAVCIEALRDKSGSVVAAIVIITNPVPPATASEDTPEAPPA